MKPEFEREDLKRNTKYHLADILVAYYSKNKLRFKNLYWLFKMNKKYQNHRIEKLLFVNFKIINYIS